MSCSARCSTQDHKTYGECLRAKSLRVAYCRSAVGLDATRQKAWDRELQGYRDARAQGVQPEGTSTTKVRQAMEISDRAGKAFDAGTRTFKD
jgi:hypothetical protein